MLTFFNIQYLQNIYRCKLKMVKMGRMGKMVFLENFKINFMFILKLYEKKR